ncbi:hypothetical protein OTU49_009574 [Cherax quadricarinatus]|uniref:Carbohydrate sulfotransferase n=1 Tax=Cherax quadricarinatus TaxID=27406 RepID=A0AAW0WII3_CHEQU
MRLRGRLRSLILLAMLSICIIVYNLVGVHVGSWDDGIYKPNSRVARITAQELLTIGHHFEPVTVASSGSEVNVATFNTTVNITTIQVESVTLPNSWTVTQELVDRLADRRNHVHEVCRKYGLDKPSETYQPNAWEFLINEKFGLIWCNVFKAASSTWFYNFNLLAGFSETELLQSKDTPIQLARKRYSRPSVEELQRAMNSSQQPLSFMIARHPLKRLVSAYRLKPWKKMGTT